MFNKTTYSKLSTFWSCKNFSCDSRCEKQTLVRQQLYRQCLLRPHWPLFSACGHLTRLSSYSLFQAPDSRAKDGQAWAKRAKENRGGSWKGAFPRPPSSYFHSPSPAFRPNDREPGKAKAAKPFVVHPGSKPRLKRPGKWKRTLRSPAALVAGFTASSQQIVWTS